VWGKMTSKRAVAERPSSEDDDDTPLWPLAEPVQLDHEYRGTEKTTKKGAYFGGSAREMTWAGCDPTALEPFSGLLQAVQRAKSSKFAL
jgi:hypothetical protein